MKQVCKYCKSEIDFECYVCPVCKQGLNIFRLKKDNPNLKKIFFLSSLFIIIYFIPRFIAVHFFESKFQIKEFQSAQKHKLEIISIETQKLKNRIIVLGQVKNNGSDKFNSINLEAEFYDKNKKVIALESGMVDGGVNPGETRSFKIASCCEVEDAKNSLKEFDSVDVKIVNGYLKK